MTAPAHSHLWLFRLDRNRARNVCITHDPCRKKKAHSNWGTEGAKSRDYWYRFALGTESGTRMEPQTWRVWGRNVTKMHREQLLRQGLSLTGLRGFSRATQPIQDFLGRVMQFTRVTQAHGLLWGYTGRERGRGTH